MRDTLGKGNFIAIYTRHAQYEPTDKNGPTHRRVGTSDIQLSFLMCIRRVKHRSRSPLTPAK